MPTYTPTTRGPGEQPQAAPQAPYPPQAQPQQPAAPQPSPQGAPRQPAAPAEQAYQPSQGQPQQAYGGNQHYQPQAYDAPAQTPSQSFNDQDLPDLSNADPAFPESIFGDFKPDASFDNDFSDHGTADQAAHDASFPEEGDAGFPDLSAEEPAYPAEPQYAPQPHAPAQQHAHAQAPQYHPQAYAAQPQAPAAPQPQAPGAHQGHGQAHGQTHGQVPPGDPSRQLQAYDSIYDQPPQIALGGGQPPVPQGQDYFETDRGDADFIDESQIAPPAGARSKLAQTLKGRSAFMVASALLGAIALGGALAFAYKQSGGGISSDTPIVTADNRPVKEAPDSPGGKEFPHKNKLIYDRLTNGDAPESERLVPRQEDVAVPALPPASATARLPGAVATTDMTTQSVDGGEEGGPRKVKTMVVRPDGSVEAPAVADAANAAAGAVAGVADAAAAQAAQAAGQTANMMPVPIPDGPVPMAAPAAPQQVAAAAPAAAAPAAAPATAAPSKYVVQVGAHKSQTEALAIYADIQQKNPKLLGNYPPLVQKASVGGGTMYRLRVGPIANKSEAYKLCGELKTQGTDCFVAVQ